MARSTCILPTSDRKAVWILLALLAPVGCGSPPANMAGEEPAGSAGAVVRTSGDLEVREARVQLFGEMGAAFFTVHNSGTEAERLVRVEAEARSVEIHETVTDGSVMRMEAREEGFVIPPGTSLRLEPGGKHVMLIEPVGAPPGAETFSLRLVFERGGTIELEADLDGLVLPVGGEAAEGPHGEGR